MNVYRLDKKFIALELVKIIGINILIAIAFYDSLLGFLWFPILVLLLFKQDANHYRERLKKQLRTEFKTLAETMQNNLKVGYSLENAWILAVEEYEKVFGKAGKMWANLKSTCNGLACNKKIEDLLFSLAKDLQVEEIYELASFLIVTKQYGGNAVSLLQQFSSNLVRRFYVEQEIDTAFAAKKYEGILMLVMPFFLICYMRITNPGYMQIMYVSGIGKIIMTVCLIGIGCAYLWINKIMRIEV